VYLSSGQKEECCGCKACVEICPKKCISLSEDNEHFPYPIINRQECINCHLCEKVCPKENHIFSKKEECEVWVGRHTSEDIIFNSSSGGAYTAIYKTLLQENYIFYGVRWTEDFKVVHDSAKTEEECERFRKSKYVLSDTNNVFSKVEEDLKRHEKVCFSGTPCQCAALISFLDLKHIKREDLVVIDIICHGGPNQYLFDQYIEGKVGGKGNLEEYSFRFKNKIPFCGKVNSRSAEIISPQGKSDILDITNDAFLRGYYGRLFYRPACGACAFARPERVSDITIGDAWHIEQDYPEWNSLEGVSLMLINTEKGRTLFEKFHDQMEIRKKDIEWAFKTNAQLREPTHMHKGRARFFRMLDGRRFEDAVNRAMDDNTLLRAAKRIKHMIVPSRGGEPCSINACPYNQKGTCRL